MINSAVSLADDGFAPNPGDFGLCLCCNSFLIYDEELALKPMKPSQFLSLLIDYPEMRKLVAVSKAKQDTLISSGLIPPRSLYDN